MINFEKYATEGNEFLNLLAKNLGHEKDKAQVGILLRAVLHELRDCISIAESFNLMAQLPMFLKALYVEQWKYGEHARVKTLAQFAKKVEEEQRTFGERQFDWNESTIDLVKTVLNTLQKYLAPGEVHDIVAELPAELKTLFSVELKVEK